MLTISNKTIEYNFIQFIERGKMFTYLPDGHPFEYEKGCKIHAVFNVKIKDSRTRFEKFMTSRKWKKYWMKHITASQINKDYNIC